MSLNSFSYENKNFLVFRPRNLNLETVVWGASRHPESQWEFGSNAKIRLELGGVWVQKEAAPTVLEFIDQARNHFAGADQR
jgi:hypothetical protein